jgi:Na+/H+ antiporter NhaD/arsenite permease-like protein
MFMTVLRPARRRLGFAVTGGIASLSSLPARAAVEGAPHLDGASLGLAWLIPFIGILLSIALFPLVRPHVWHRHYGKVAAFWGLTFLLPFAVVHGADLALYEVLTVALTEYLPFIILLAALFVVAGGVRLKGTLVGTPTVNLGILFVGTAIASWMGTTGACMLLIRPLLRANENRCFRVHTVVFFIFLVGNIGGSLTPLGDPPLFLGFLQGVSFFWPTQHLLLPMLFCSVILLALYFAIDTVLFRREHSLREVPVAARVPFGLEGGINLLLLVGVVAAVLLSGVWRPGVELTVYHVPVALENLVRDLALLAIIGLSWVLTSRDSRRLNDFNWFPIVEVGKLFAAIFVTIVPAIAILRAGRDGALAPLVDLVGGAGAPNDLAYFWLTGLLSSFLDNAPTYLVFFNMAGADPVHLMGSWATTLGAISAGAVFMGANTYIGNAPNFMVRSIAQERGVAMPSFFGYMAWSGGILLPLFLLVSLVFYAG